MRIRQNGLFRIRGYTGETVTILKRLTVWSLERSIEACLLGGLFGYLLSLSAEDPSLTLRNALSAFWVFGIAVAVFLFICGYYVTDQCSC